MVHPTNPRVLFERVKALWPTSLALGSDPLKTLNDVYWPLERELGNADEWLSLGAWAFHQSLWQWITHSHACAGTVVMMADAPFSVFDHCMRENLADECWSEERAAYGATIQ